MESRCATGIDLGEEVSAGEDAADCGMRIGGSCTERASLSYSDRPEGIEVIGGS